MFSETLAALAQLRPLNVVLETDGKDLLTCLQGQHCKVDHGSPKDSPLQLTGELQTSMNQVLIQRTLCFVMKTYVYIYIYIHIILCIYIYTCRRRIPFAVGCCWHLMQRLQRLDGIEAAFDSHC